MKKTLKKKRINEPLGKMIAKKYGKEYVKPTLPNKISALWWKHVVKPRLEKLGRNSVLMEKVLDFYMKPTLFPRNTIRSNYIPKKIYQESEKINYKLQGNTFSEIIFDDITNTKFE